MKTNSLTIRDHTEPSLTTISSLQKKKLGYHQLRIHHNPHLNVRRKVSNLYIKKQETSIQLSAGTITTPHGPTEGLRQKTKLEYSNTKYYIHITTDYPALQPCGLL
jgi:hypothetical protein